MDGRHNAILIPEFIWFSWSMLSWYMVQLKSKWHPLWSSIRLRMDAAASRPKPIYGRRCRDSITVVVIVWLGPPSLARSRTMPPRPILCFVYTSISWFHSSRCSTFLFLPSRRALAFPCHTKQAFWFWHVKAFNWNPMSGDGYWE
jgi:hypothetical protein